VLYTDAITSREAQERNCRTIEGVPVTVIQAPRPRQTASAPAPAATARPADAKVDPAAQRARDNDARRILNDELRREEARLAEMRREFNNGEPERLGDERNYQRYLDRVAEMRAALARKEADVAALQRELAKLPTQ
jgi:predicted RNase H-like nuclease (RuvC/YqgF family)